MNKHDTECILKLRALEPEDLDALYLIENDEELWEVGQTNVPYSKYTLNNYILSASNDIYADKQVRLVMENECHRVVGLLDIQNFDPRHNRAEIGIVVVKNERGKGYGIKALKKAIEYARSFLHLHQIYAIVDDNNKKCVQLFESAGFTANSTLSQWLRCGETYHNALLMQLFL